MGATDASAFVENGLFPGEDPMEAMEAKAVM